jgi:hypothetical protein
MGSFHVIEKAKEKLSLWLCRRHLSVVLMAAPALSGCISSTDPVLSDASAILGERIEVHLFSAPKAGRREHTAVAFQWTAGRYVPRSRTRDFGDFTVHPYEGRDLIIQTRAVRSPRPTEYALARKLTDGAYLVIPIDEDDADETARQRFCIKTADASCRIATPEQLFVFARTSAAKEDPSGGIAVIMPGARR